MIASLCVCEEKNTCNNEEKNASGNLNDREQERTLILSCRGLIHSLCMDISFLQGEVGAPGGQGPPGPVGSAGPSGITLIGVSRKALHRKHDNCTVIN